MSIDSTLAELGLSIPTPARPVAAYIPAVRAGNLLFISGQLPLRDGKLLATGPVPTSVTPADARDAAQQCILNVLAAARAELGGDLGRIKRVVRIGVFVQCVDGNTDQPAIANGASELLQKLFGEPGRHARAAVGVNALPLNASVEIDAIFEVA